MRLGLCRLLANFGIKGQDISHSFLTSDEFAQVNGISLDITFSCSKIKPIFMKLASFALMASFCSLAFADTPDVAIPDHDAELIKTTDYVEVSGSNDLGGAENFTIHNAKAIGQFIDFLTSDRYVAVPKDLNPQFKSLSLYKVRLSAHGTLVLELQIIADSIIDLPDETSYYMQSDRHSDNLLAPLLRLR